MPHKPSRPCRYPGCVHTTLATTGYCEAHAFFYKPPERAVDRRPSAPARGYNHDWNRVRTQVLRDAGIPKELWPKYDVHHSPEYDAQIEPDHRKYTLTPMLHGEHSAETGHSRGRGDKSLPVSSRDRTCPTFFFASKMDERGKNGR